MVWQNYFTPRKMSSHVYFPESHHSWGLNRGMGWRISYFSGLRMCSLTTVIQHEVVLSIPVLLRPARDEDIVISKEVLQARYLDKINTCSTFKTKSWVRQQQFIGLYSASHSDTIMFSCNDRSILSLHNTSALQWCRKHQGKNVKYDCPLPPKTPTISTCIFAYSYISTLMTFAIITYILLWQEHLKTLFKYQSFLY